MNLESPKINVSKSPEEVFNFLADIKNNFEEGARLQFNLAPPILAKRDKNTGLPRKRTFGAWMLRAFALLAPLKVLRGSALDVFGYTEERKMERNLISEYEQMIEAVLPSLNQHNLEQLVALAELPQMIKGYGHIKLKAVEEYRAEREKMLLEINNKASDEHAVKAA